MRQLVDEVCSEVKKDILRIQRKTPFVKVMNISFTNLIDFAYGRVIKRRKKKRENERAGTGTRK